MRTPSIDQVEAPAKDAFIRLLHAHAASTRALSADLVSEHGLTINDFEALLYLARAPDHQMRRVDLARRLLLTASGVSRLLDGLEREGYVTKGDCATDARVTYAVLTESGWQCLEEASRSHLAAIREIFEANLSDDELRTLSDLLARLPGAGRAARADRAA
jgi:DNA-binding MarR family transcriptional regulator